MLSHQIVLKWETKSKAPRVMSRAGGAAVVSGNVAYFNSAVRYVHNGLVERAVQTFKEGMKRSKFGTQNARLAFSAEVSDHTT